MIKKFFAPLFKNSLLAFLAATIMLVGALYVFRQTAVRSTKGLPLATFQQNTADSRQVIIVRSKDFNTSDATLEAQEFDGTKWNTVVGPIKAKIGKNGFSASHKEGDGTSPQGVFTIKESFGNQKPLDGARLAYKKLDLNSWWVSDPDSPNYNKWETGPPSGRWRESYGEHLADSQYIKAYRYAAVIDYNRDPIIPGSGSAIFLHVGGDKATSGCVGIAESELVRILKWMDPDKKPRIVMGTDPWLLTPNDAPGVVGSEPVGLAVTTPTRILDTRSGIGAPVGKVGPKSVTTLKVRGAAGVPADATVVALNLTIDQPSLQTFLTVSPSGNRPLPTVSNLNVHAGEQRAAMVMARIGDDGDIRIANSEGAAHLIADVVGYGSPKVKGGYQSTTPKRVLDTRIGLGLADKTAKAPLGANTLLDLPLNNAPLNATAVIMNITATGTTQPTFITAFAGGTPQPDTSTLNVRANQDTANLAIVPLGKDSVLRFFNSAGDTHVIADVFGWILADRGDRYVPAEEPVRVMDTRSGVGQRGQIREGEPVELLVKGLPATTTGLAITVTGVNASSGTDLRVYPSQLTSDSQTFSNVNLSKGDATANLVMVSVGQPGLRDKIENRSGATDVIVDVSGWFVSRP